MTPDLERVRSQLEGRVPDGYDLANLVLLDVAGHATLEEVPDAELAKMRRTMKTAEMPIMDDRGRPTRLLIDAWMVHADVPNLNRQLFLSEDLEKQSAFLARSPDFLVMDWNHSAVMPWKDGPKAIGAWYEVGYEFDPAASRGKGAMGLHAKGMMWAWLFPEQANIMLGEQAREGYVTFSMAAIAKRRSYQDDPVTGETVTVLHEPVFFTLSALDVQPADPDARGRVSMAHEEVEAATAAAQIPEDTRMNEAEFTAMQARVTELEAKVAELTGALAVSEAAHADIKSALTSAEEQIAALETSLAEATSGREALVAEQATQHAAATEAFTALEAERDALAAELAEIREAQRLENEAKSMAERLLGLPVSFQKAHAARSDEQRERIEAKWKSMSDAEWEQYKADELLFGFEKSMLRYTDRSHAEGGLLPTGGTTEDLKSRVARITK